MVKEQFIRTVRKAGTSLAISIPKDIVKLSGVKEGDMLKIEIEKVDIARKRNNE